MFPHDAQLRPVGRATAQAIQPVGESGVRRGLFAPKIATLGEAHGVGTAAGCCGLVQGLLRRYNVGWDVERNAGYVPGVGELVDGGARGVDRQRGCHREMLGAAQCCIEIFGKAGLKKGPVRVER